MQNWLLKPLWIEGEDSSDILEDSSEILEDSSDILEDSSDILEVIQKYWKLFRHIGSYSGQISNGYIIKIIKK